MSEAKLMEFEVEEGTKVPAAEGHLGLFSSINMIAGVVIGSGIFASASGAYVQLGSVGLTLIFWVLAGLLSMMGAFCYAELGCAMPQSGGEHNYLMRAFGPYAAYSFDWVQALLAYPLSCATISVVVGQYLGALVMLQPSLPPAEQVAPSDLTMKIVAIAVIAIFTALNCFSGVLAAKLNNVFTIIKFLALGLIIVIGFVFLGNGSTENFRKPFEGTTTDIGKIGYGMYFLLFTYGGWNNLNACLGEMKQPEKKLPIAVTVALSAVITVYLLANISYFAVLPLDVIVNTKIIATEVGYRALGPTGSILVPIFVILCASGAVNGLIFANARLIGTFAAEGIILPRRFAHLHPKRQTPIAALVLTGMCSAALTLVGDFDFLIKMYSFTTWLFFFVTAVGLIVLRFKEPNMPRPFRVWTPVAYVFCMVAAFLVIFPFTKCETFMDVVPYGVAIVFAIIPMPIVFFMQKRRGTLVSGSPAKSLY